MVLSGSFDFQSPVDPRRMRTLLWGGSFLSRGHTIFSCHFPRLCDTGPLLDESQLDSTIGGY